MPSLIQKIANLAIRSFNREQIPSRKFNAHIEQIKTMVNTVTWDELNIDPRRLEDTRPFDPVRDSAPVTYMNLYEDEDLTICVFILKNGVRLPLHDHPNMNGILKVIYGNVYLQRYTLLDEAASLNPGSSSASSGPNIHTATKHPLLCLTPNDPACSLGPKAENIHEIRSIDGPAAFLDILSPPYGRDKRTGYERDCHYFEEVKFSSDSSLEKNKVVLVNIPTPREFWCDQDKYLGPSLHNLEED